MADIDPELARILHDMDSRVSKVEGRLEEQSKAIATLNEGQREIRDGQRHILLTQWTIGVTTTAGLFGVLIALILRLGSGG